MRGIIPDTKYLKSGSLIVGVFVLGLMTAKYLPSKGEKKHDSDDVMVEKISDDSLKLSTETIKNLKLSAVKYGEVPEQFSVMGKISVAEDRTSLVAARVSGRIDSVYASSGAIVKAGAPLASVVSPDFIIAREEYLQSQAQAREGDQEEKNILALSVQKLESMGASRSDISHLDKTEKTSHLVIRAPRSGAIIDKKAVPGNLINPGDSLFTVGDTDSIWFAGDIYPTDVDKVHKGQDVIIQEEGSSAPVKGKVSFISPLIDPVTRTIKIRAQMENPGNSLRLDMYVRGNIILSEKPAMTIPKSALVREGNSFVCFKLFPNNVFKKVNVEDGRRSQW